MSEPDDRVERAYRSLPREEPPASLDAAILAASRRAVARPSFVRRWGVPVSLAAMTVLAVGVSLEMQHEKPGIESSTAGVDTRVAAPAPASPEAEAPQENRSVPAAAEPGPPAHLAAPTQSARVPIAPRPMRRLAPHGAPAPTAREAAPAAPPQASAAPGADMAAAPTASGASANVAQKRMQSEVDPHAALEKMARLRASGRDAEADRALEDFRRRFPGYRIDDATWERVRPR